MHSATAHPLMNNTKWEELRVAMYELSDLSPRWRTKDVQSGYICPWDGEWFYHFSLGDYKSIHWLEIEVISEAQRHAVQCALTKIRVPAARTEIGFKVYGYAEGGDFVQYLANNDSTR